MCDCCSYSRIGSLELLIITLFWMVLVGVYLYSVGQLDVEMDLDDPVKNGSAAVLVVLNLVDGNFTRAWNLNMCIPEGGVIDS